MLLDLPSKSIRMYRDMGLRMLLLLHATIPCLYLYAMMQCALAKKVMSEKIFLTSIYRSSYPLNLLRLMDMSGPSFHIV